MTSIFAQDTADALLAVLPVKFPNPTKSPNLENFSQIRNFYGLCETLKEIKGSCGFVSCNVFSEAVDRWRLSIFRNGNYIFVSTRKHWLLVGSMLLEHKRGQLLWLNWQNKSNCTNSVSEILMRLIILYCFWT